MSFGRNDWIEWWGLQRQSGTVVHDGNGQIEKDQVYFIETKLDRLELALFMSSNIAGKQRHGAHFQEIQHQTLNPAAGAVSKNLLIGDCCASPGTLFNDLEFH